MAGFDSTPTGRFLSDRSQLQPQIYTDAHRFEEEPDRIYLCLSVLISGEQVPVLSAHLSACRADSSRRLVRRSFSVGGSFSEGGSLGGCREIPTPGDSLSPDPPSPFRFQPLAIRL
jgi:hypothetical protein